MAGLIWNDLELLRPLGSGHAGRVTLARLTRQYGEFKSGQEVAVKQYNHWVLEQPGQMERIVRELEVGRRVDHPGLVRTLTLVSDPMQRPALVMEYLPGPSLEDLLQRIRGCGEQLAFQDCIHIGRQLLAALDALHSAGGIHRDIKPTNIIMSPRGPVLLDLGVVQSTHFPEQTAIGTFLGTIRYAAPEYLFGETYDSRVDVFSLGAVLVELLSGEQFRARLNHWARLVVAAELPPKLPLKKIARTFGYNAACFAELMLSRMLVKLKWRSQAHQILELMRDNPWEHAFYAADQGVVIGEPLVWSEGDLVPLSMVVPKWRKKIRPEALEQLKNHIAEAYDGLPVYIWHRDEQDPHPDLQRYELIKHTGTDAGELIYMVNEEVFTALRLGLL